MTWSKETVSRIEQHGYRIVGELADLLPVVDEGLRRPDDVSTEELLDAAMDALAELSQRYATVWWNSRKSDVGIEERSKRVRTASTLRAVTFRGQRRAADLADRSPTAARLMGVYLAARAARTRRAARR